MKETPFSWHLLLHCKGKKIQTETKSTSLFIAECEISQRKEILNKSKFTHIGTF
jgi:hypothetical protein